MSKPGTDKFPPLPQPLPTPVVDNHCHLDFGDRDGGRALSVADQVAAAREVGIEHIITVGCSLDSARWTAQAIREHEGISGAVAIHPNDAADIARAGGQSALDEALALIDELLDTPGMVAVGETGLDWFRTSRKDEVAREAQFASFRAHIDFAKKRDLPMQIHDRDAHRDVLDLLVEVGAPEKTVFHCFSGDGEMARECGEKGYYMSFSGNITFKNAPELREAVIAAPLNRILVETDAPFMTPVPYRGKVNASYLIPHTMRLIAELKEVSLEQACAAVRENTREVYGV
ncbi:TatD family hydrolase [Dermabacteraceae bacterium CCM 9519]